MRYGVEKECSPETITECPKIHCQAQYGSYSLCRLNLFRLAGTKLIHRPSITAVKFSAKEQQKKAPKSKIEEAFLKQKEEQESQRQVENMSREEKFRRKGKAKIKNLKPKDYEDGYYVDEFGEKQKQEKRAKEIL